MPFKLFYDIIYIELFILKDKNIKKIKINSVTTKVKSRNDMTIMTIDNR